MDKVTVKLQSPKDHGGKTITELVMVKPLPKHMKKFKPSQLTDLSFGEAIEIFSILCNEPPSFIENLEFDDFNALGGALSQFFPEPN